MPSWWQLATGDGTPKQAARIALIVGTVLVAINQGDVILAGLTPVWWKACLTYCVPFCVATWGAVTAKRTHLRRAAAGSEQTGVSPAG
jgi:hypothetical protein